MQKISKPFSLFNLKRIFFLFSIFTFCIQGINSVSQAQNKTDKLVQFSGMVVESDSLYPVPFAHIVIHHSRRGTISDYYGFFSFVAEKNDTIEFSSLGYKKAYFIIPDTLTTNRYSLIQVLQNDTVMLRELLVYPWPSKEQFKEAFLNLDIADDDLQKANKNLVLAEMKQRVAGMPMDGSLGYKYQMQQIQSKLYYAGQAPPINLMNPIAWANFIKAWKAGELKIKNE